MKTKLKVQIVQMKILEKIGKYHMDKINGYHKTDGRIVFDTRPNTLLMINKKE